MDPEGPANGHVYTGFLIIPLSLRKYWDGSQVPSSYGDFSSSTPDFSSTQIQRFGGPLIYFRILQLNVNQKIRSQWMVFVHNSSQIDVSLLLD
jgi:hypothetical protein